jgi:hypothetical protein
MKIMATIETHMKTKSVVFAVAASALLLAIVSPSRAQDWTSTSAPNGIGCVWTSVASSADGAKLVAASPTLGLMETSTDSGATWSACGAPSNAWYSVASSADGTRLAAVTFNGSVYTSPDSGGTWTDVLDVPINSTFPIRNFLPSIASSADGTKLAAMVCPNGTGQWIIISTNSGATWVTNYSGAFYANTNGGGARSSFGSVVSSVASSADGTKLAVAFAAGDVCTSVDGGLNWTSNNLPQFNWNSIASSADGKKLVLATGLVGLLSTPIYLSTNGGSTWQMSGAPTNLNTSWRAVASSADGSRLVAVCGWGLNNSPQFGRIYTSADSGLTWVANNAFHTFWSSVASSADGRKLVATIGVDSSGIVEGGICISQSTPAPCLNITPQGDGIALSWIVPSANFVLQQNSDLTTTNWTDVVISPALNLTKLQYQLTVPLTGSLQYYRLAAQ